MADKDHGGTQEPLQEHSLPGTNQAGKGSDSAEKTDDGAVPSGGRLQRTTQHEEHSLPGTNQAGKRPAPRGR